MTTSTRTTPARRVGRRHKGSRHLFQSRVPDHIAADIMAEAERRGLTYSDYIAMVLATAHGHNLPYVDDVDERKQTSVQEEIPMRSAS